jgi:protein-S-isoprenylcysteine O-methyltransferase Ste14
MMLPVIATVIFAVTFVAEKIMLWGHRVTSATNWDKSSLWVFDISGLLSLPVGIFLGYTSIGRIHAAYTFISLSGIVLMLFGTTLRWIAIFTLKDYFTVNVTIFKDHQIVDHGLYKYLRHPSYLGLLVRYLGFGLAFGNWLSALCIFTPLFGAVLYRIHVEEIALNQALGGQYAEYSKTTRRLIPKIY